METLARRDRPWPDLPDPLLENILERLPLSGYVRFSAVCRRWLSVQTARRRRHSPSPPPMLRLPWLISLGPHHQETLSCYSPFEDKFFTFPVPFLIFSVSFGSFDGGWLLNLESGGLVLLNPVSGHKIELPQLIHVRGGPNIGDGVVAISPPPHYLVSIARYSTISLLRWFDSDWVELKIPEAAAWRMLTVCISGKHYRTLSERWPNPEASSHDLLVVDALATPPTFQLFEMARLRPTAVKTVHGATHLVGFGEEPLLVKEILDEKTVSSVGRIILGFEVYRADLDGKMWVKVESLGDDRVIVIHCSRAVSLLAADIGARGNCIYFTTGQNSGQGRWKVFDLGTGRVTGLQLPNASRFQNYVQLLFVPTLC